MIKTVIKHSVYHLIFGLIYFIIFSYLTEGLSLEYLAWILLGSYFLDLDHLAHHYIYQRKHFTAIAFRQIKKKHGIIKALIDTGHWHKNRDRLIFHNLYWLGFLLAAFTTVAILKLTIFTAFTGAMIMHLLFDVLDDLFVLGHLDHWVWKKKSRIF